MERLYISAKTKGEDISLIDTLASRNIEAKLIRGAVLVQLPENESHSWDNPVFDIPSELKDPLLLIEAVEEGGGMSNTGEGVIVCGLSGKKLRPYYIPTGGPLSNAVHAHFSVPEAVVTIEVTEHHTTTAVIRENRIIREGNTARIQVKVLWSGRIKQDLKEVPALFARFIPAIKAGWDKIQQYHCRHAYYYIETR